MAARRLAPMPQPTTASSTGAVVAILLYKETNSSSWTRNLERRCRPRAHAWQAWYQSRIVGRSD
jgi:hypothetical protein